MFFIEFLHAEIKTIFKHIKIEMSKQLHIMYFWYLFLMFKIEEHYISLGLIPF